MQWIHNGSEILQQSESNFGVEDVYKKIDNFQNVDFVQMRI